MIALLIIAVYLAVTGMLLILGGIVVGIIDGRAVKRQDDLRYRLHLEAK